MRVVTAHGKSCDTRTSRGLVYLNASVWEVRTYFVTWAECVELKAVNVCPIV